MTDVPVWVPLLSAALGGSLVGLFNFFTNLVNKKSEERRHFREILFSAALSNWKEDRDALLNFRKEGYKVELSPIDTYIIHLMKLAEVLKDENLTSENIAAKLDEVLAVSNAATDHLKAHSKRRADKKSNG